MQDITNVKRPWKVKCLFLISHNDGNYMFLCCILSHIYYLLVGKGQTFDTKFEYDN
jgi:hypothetical protein